MNRSMETTAAAPGAPASCEIARLLGDLLVASLARLGPVTACSATVVCQAFHAVADSDALWSHFLPHDPPPFADAELSKPSLPKKELFKRLSNGPALLADGLMCLWIDKETGGICYLLSARKLSIALGDDPTYWRWIPIDRFRLFPEGAELLDSGFMEIHGSIDSKLLSRHTTYTAYIVYTLAIDFYGLHHPEKESCVRLGGPSGDVVSTGNVCLVDGWLYSEHWVVMREYLPDDCHFPRDRDGGWMMEAELGEFRTGGEGDDDGEVSISLVGTSCRMCGLIVLGIEIRPKKEEV